MKIAILGKGKTGSKVIELAQEAGYSFTVFDSINKPTIDNLKDHDVVISFFSGEVFQDFIPMLIDSKIPVVCGSTGFKWPLNFDTTLKEKKLTWIYATNFSLGMNLIHQMIKIMAKAEKIFSQYKFSLHEIHHTKKFDSPSGTALSWRDWSLHNIDITSERIGDVTGIHELKLSTNSEEITLKHEALNRRIFAEGALYASHILKSTTPGLHLFQDIVQHQLE